ncbi:DUF4942 domain-containing protein [Photobacterium leiognathi]|uniref:DUF4942 domain-containing protein n=1 Tax=Photobacterium leiognathi TaxID=553611 RepID=UPI0029816DD4|nr:DUF4942 domain-containing protein [Photobacterium leiognathi]
MNKLVEQKLIDKLVRHRVDFIETNFQAIKSHREAIKLAELIDDSIPRKNEGYITCFDNVFYSISRAFGENTKGRVRPKEASIKHKNDAEIHAIITKIVDGHLWSILFNRLGLLKKMSRKQQDAFKLDCCEPQPFVLENIVNTLAAMHENQESDLLNSLYDTFSSLSATYASNNQRKFSNKIIIENTFVEYADSFKLRSHEPLETLLTVVWHWVLMHRWSFDENGVTSNNIWHELSETLSNCDQDYERIRSISSHGIEFRFFKKKTVHVLFPESMISILNEQLSKSDALPPC